MRTINNRSYPGVLIKAYHTLKQMNDFLSRSKGVTREYWIERIANYEKRYGHDKR
tara:strand:+ start:347 stop:511 length:165 start_codon:yes stop_codon:yes gene_type:complete